MDRSKKMTETESEIMEVLWSAEAPMSASELIDYFAALVSVSQRGRKQVYPGAVVWDP